MSGFEVAKICEPPALTSMRERVELPIGLDLPPSMREPLRLEDEEKYDRKTDRDLAQECDVISQCQCAIDCAVAQQRADPFHRFRQQYHEGGAHQRPHDGAGAADDHHREEDN